MRLIPINPPSTITEPQIPDAIARDTEVSAAIAAHIAASNPHSQYLSQNGKAADSELIDGIDSSRIVFGDDWSKTLGIDINSTISSNSGFLDCYSGGTFPSGIAHINGFQCRHRNNASIWGMQAGCQHNISTEFYFRTISSGVWQPWRRVWNDGNFDPNNHAQIFTQAAKALFLSNSGQISLQPPGGGGLEIQSVSGGAACFSFHRPGSHAVFFGLDVDNYLKLGGWSLSGAYKLWHEAFGTPVWQTPSDKRFKNSVKPIKNALAVLMDAMPVGFRYTAEIRKQELFGDLQTRCKRHYGFMAQDFPITDLVFEKEGDKGIDYLEVIPFLVRAIQELQEQINELKQQNTS